MSSHPEVPMSDDDGRQLLEDELKWREREDFHAWLDEREKEKVRDLEYHLFQMMKELGFDKILNANQPKEASNGTDSQKT